MRRRALAGVVLAGAVCFSGCGGPMKPEELSRSIQTLESTAAEGALLADDVARDRTKATFARVHARELGETAEHEAEKLNDAEAEPEGGVAPSKVRAIDLADRISAALGRIQIAPDSETEGRAAEEALSGLSERAGQLAEGL
jgi:outer membrane murein-binding lipoprotein Lpp